MKNLHPKLLLFLAATVGAQFGHQALSQEVQVTGVTKRVFHQQTGPAQTHPTDAGFSAFIEGEELSPSYPSGPRTVTVPGGEIVPLTFDEDGWYIKEDFTTRADMDQRFANGAYLLKFGGVDISLNLAGDSYPVIPLATLSEGQWVNGIIKISAADAEAGFDIVSNQPNGNGFASIYIEGEEDGFFQDWVQQHSNNPIRVEIPPGALQPGYRYVVELEFDNVVHSKPAGVDSATAFALYSSTTWLDLEVTENLTPLQLSQPGISAAGLFGFTITGGVGQSITVQATTNFLSWTNLQTISLANGSAQFTDADTKEIANRYYRVIIQ